MRPGCIGTPRGSDPYAGCALDTESVDGALMAGSCTLAERGAADAALDAGGCCKDVWDVGLATLDKAGVTARAETEDIAGDGHVKLSESEGIGCDEIDVSLALLPRPRGSDDVAFVFFLLLAGGRDLDVTGYDRLAVDGGDRMLDNGIC